MSVSDSGDEGGRRRKKRDDKKQRPFWQELPILVVIAAVI
ncbi:signal peptidase I, partial [Nocardia salmonicida]